MNQLVIPVTTLAARRWIPSINQLFVAQLRSLRSASNGT